MTDTFSIGRLTVSADYHAFVKEKLLKGLDITADRFFSALEALLSEFSAENEALLAKRAALQEKLDTWHAANPGPVADMAAYTDFLREIGYLVSDHGDFTIETQNVDAEIAQLAGPQLVVPVDNARYALNAANARWGSLYDALYGTDAMGSTAPKGAYSDARGAEVIRWAKGFLNEAVPLAGARHDDVTGYHIVDGALVAETASGPAALADASAFIGYQGDAAAPTAILLAHHGLHIELQIDRSDRIGSADPAGIKDVVLESALTSIMDCEDSVATIAPAEKVTAYTNWLGLMRGDLVASFKKGNKTVERRLEADRTYTTQNGDTLTLGGQVVMLVRNVGHLTRHTAVLFDGSPVFEGLMDALTTTTAGIHGIKRTARTPNSRHGSIYIVKPKMHGPEEVAFACRVMARVEALLGLPANTIKIGIMDEERRTSVNLTACVRAAKERVFFINTGFLDRTGDEIHTIKKAGPVITKADMKTASWLMAYEDRNVDVGLRAGFRGRAQIGKGMWAMPDLMADLVKLKGAQLEAGASTAWVPSPTAATLHALHYHRISVQEAQATLAERAVRPVEDLLAMPVAAQSGLTAEAVASDLERNAQSILGYVVRWIDQGVGCSKVPDIDNVGLMEDRATLRISSQHIANWLMHGLVSADEIDAAFRRMALVVDAQNAADPLYQPMAPDYDGVAFKAALVLALEGASQPSGYTEPLLGTYRAKALDL